MAEHEIALQTRFWRLQPRWLKLTMICIGLPAWCIFAVFGVFWGELSSPVVHVAIAVFVSIGLLELAFVAKALWRQDL